MEAERAEALANDKSAAARKELLGAVKATKAREALQVCTRAVC